MIQSSKKGILRVSLYLLPALTLLALLTAPTAHADGGAPQLAYIAGAGQGISAYDIAQNKVTSRIAVAGDPRVVQLSLDGRFLYIAQPGLGRMTMLAARTGQQICSASLPGRPALLALDPVAGSNVLYAAGGVASVSAINASTCAIIHTFTTSAPVDGLAVTDLGAGSTTVDEIWASCGNVVNVMDTGGRHLATIPVAGGPQYITIPPGTTAYVTTRQGGVDAIDLQSHRVFALLSGGSFGPMDFDAVTGEVYVPDRQNERLDVLTPLTSPPPPLPEEPAHTYKLDAAPQAVAITSDGQLGFVALSGGKVAMIDVPGENIINTVNVGGNPQFIITGLYPPLVGTTPQSASTWGTVISVLAYAFVLALIVVPIVLFRRYSRARIKKTA
jgi:DNA-binding beta-propeller fold protein YncE